MRIVNRVIALIMLLVMTVSLCSCFAVREFFKNEEIIVKETLAYMKEKYCGQEFVFDHIIGQNKKSIICCYPEGSDIETDPVDVERSVADGKVKYRDTYFNILIRDDIEADIVGMCKDLGMPMTVTFSENSMYVDDQFDGTKTYADYKVWAQENKSSHLFHLSIFIHDDDDCESLAQEIVDRVQTGRIHGALNMFFYPIETYTEENLQNDMDGIDYTRIFKLVDWE